MGFDCTKGWPRSGAIAALLIGQALAGVFAAHAQDDDASSSDVYARLRPEYDPIGIRTGTFFLFPSVSSGGGANGNVFNDSSATQDYFYTVTTGLKMQSAWSRHELAVSAQTTSLWYSNQVSENRNDWDVSAKLRLDFMRGSELTVEGIQAFAHEVRGTDLTGGLLPGDPAEPTAYSRSAFNGAYEQEFNRVRVTLGGRLEQLDYNDTPRVLPAPTADFNNDDRDRSITEVFAKTAVEAWSSTAVFVRGGYTATNFTAAFDDDGYNRDSTSMRVDGGFEFAMTHVLVGEVSAGYEMKTFDSAQFADAADVAVAVGLKWFPTMLTTVRLDGSRSIEETSIADASGFVSTKGQVGIDHELLRNLIVSGKVGYENDEYADVARNDDILKGSVSGRYLINNNLHLDAGWEFVDRTSNQLPYDYAGGQFQISLTGKM